MDQNLIFIGFQTTLFDERLVTSVKYHGNIIQSVNLYNPFITLDSLFYI